MADLINILCNMSSKELGTQMGWKLPLAPFFSFWKELNLEPMV